MVRAFVRFVRGNKMDRKKVAIWGALCYIAIFVVAGAMLFVWETGEDRPIGPTYQYYDWNAIMPEEKSDMLFRIQEEGGMIYASSPHLQQALWYRDISYDEKSYPINNRLMGSASFLGTEYREGIPFENIIQIALPK